MEDDVRMYRIINVDDVDGRSILMLRCQRELAHSVHARTEVSKATNGLIIADTSLRLEIASLSWLWSQTRWAESWAEVSCGSPFFDSCDASFQIKNDRLNIVDACALPERRIVSIEMVIDGELFYTVDDIRCASGELLWSNCRPPRNTLYVRTTEKDVSISGENDRVRDVRCDVNQASARCSIPKRKLRTSDSTSRSTVSKPTLTSKSTRAETSSVTRTVSSFTMVITVSAEWNLLYTDCRDGYRW